VREICKLLDEKDPERKIKLVAGGVAFDFDELLYRRVGADATARNATDAVAVIQQLILPSLVLDPV
jgi:methanogenic corrinoid protein MtbC1